MKVCITGATGFLGGHLARALADRGDHVRATYRSESGRATLAERGFDPVAADAVDRAAMRRACAGCEMVFHTAGLVRSTPLDAVWRANAYAPRVVVEAAAAEGVRRVVLTSSVSALGPSPPGEPITEEPALTAGDLGLAYADAKREGELEAVAAGARTGVEVVVVNPSYVLGPTAEATDGRPSSNRIVSGYLRGRIPCAVDGHTNIVDVRDVTKGHLRAAARGEPGERYLLGGTDIGWVSLLERVAELSGIDHPFVVLPPEVAGAARRAEELGLPLPIAAEGFGLMAQSWSCRSTKARRELGYRTRKLDTTLRDTIAWTEEYVGHASVTDHMSPLSLGADVLRLAKASGALAGVGVVERMLGRRLVAGR